MTEQQHSNFLLRYKWAWHDSKFETPIAEPPSLPAFLNAQAKLARQGSGDPGVWTLAKTIIEGLIGTLSFLPSEWQHLKRIEVCLDPFFITMTEEKEGSSKPDPDMHRSCIFTW